jgi:hypothetical protein
VYVPDPVTTFKGDVIPGIDDWVEIPVFWGPIVSLTRRGPELDIAAEGKESRGLAPYIANQGYTIKAGTKIIDAIHMVMDKLGENRYHMPEGIDQKLGRSRTVSAKAEPWRIVANRKDIEGFNAKFRKRTPKTKKGKNASDGKGKDQPKFTTETTHPPGLVHTLKGQYDCFYDGDGKLRVRKKRNHPVYTFKEGVNVGPAPEITYDVGDSPNKVVVTGGKRKGHEPAKGVFTLPHQHPMSPQKMSRNGRPVFRTLFVNASDLKSDKECHDHAKEIAEKRARETVDVQMDVLPIPMLEEGDVIRFNPTYGGHVDFTLKQFSIPLTSDSLMSIGHHDRYKIHKRSWSRKAARRHHRRHRDDKHRPSPFRRHHPRWARHHPRKGTPPKGGHRFWRQHPHWTRKHHPQWAKKHLNPPNKGGHGQNGRGGGN